MITRAAVKSRTPEDGLRRHSYYLLTRKSYVATVANSCNEIASLRRCVAGKGTSKSLVPKISKMH